MSVAFAKYEALRFPRTKAIVEMSLQSAKMGELKHPLAAGLRNTIMKTMRSVISDRFTSLHAYRADAGL